MLSEVYKCFDLDKDGLLERVELLDVTEQLYDKMGEVFNVKNRRETVQWFKDAGAEGDTKSGMYLDFAKWKTAYLQVLVEKSGSAGDPGKIADYLYETIAKPLFEIMYPSAATKADNVGEGEAQAPVQVAPPEYPVTIPLTGLKNVLETAKQFQRSALVITSDKDEVERFFAYESCVEIDCKKIIGEVFVSKKVSKEEALADASAKLKSAMHNQGFCRPLHICLGSSAFDWNSFCSDAMFPSQVFSPALWSVEDAHKCGLIDDKEKMTLTLDDRWKDFHVIITSKFSPEAAGTHLPDKIPHYDEP